MATKSKTVFFCTNCGNEYAKWMGRCPACGEWNTLVEKEVVTGKRPAAVSVPGAGRKPMPLKDVSTSAEDRVSLGSAEVDRLLGGGIVKGSLVLMGGEPGIGKSTLSLQLPLNRPELKTLYVTGEESVKQVKMRADRLMSPPSCSGSPSSFSGSPSSFSGLSRESQSNILIFSETDMTAILSEAEEVSPDLLIVDSVQTMYCPSVDSTAGSVSQIKEVAATLLRFAKGSGIPVILIGHITKEGTIAGPKILEHIVDVVLQFEGENRGAYRVLRSIKNRFGSTSELAVFEMTGTGLREVENPSEMLIPMHEEGLSGTAICAMLDGNRPFLFEVQALVSSAVYGTAQRSATGFDVRRLNMLLAVLERRAGFKLGQKDVFLNMAGGLRITDPACDLAVICAVLSSNFDYSIPADVCFAGEVGLSGEIRPVSQAARRATEAARLGFKRIFVSSYTHFDTKPSGIEVVKVADIPALVRALFK